MDKAWYDDGLCFTCQQCGNCCTGENGYVWLSWEELKNIDNYLQESNLGHISAYIRRIGTRFSLLEKSNGDCVFLKYEQNGKAICQINSVKPNQCKTWPFWRTLLENKDTWDKEAQECPGMNQGRYHAVEEINRITDFTS